MYEIAFLYPDFFETFSLDILNFSFFGLPMYGFLLPVQTCFVSWCTDMGSTFRTLIVLWEWSRVRNGLPMTVISFKDTYKMELNFLNIFYSRVCEWWQKGQCFLAEVATTTTVLWFTDPYFFEGVVTVKIIRI